MITYEQCKALKECGFPQKKKKHSQYYLTSDYIIDFETAHDIYMSSNAIYKGEEEIEWTKSLIYIPEFIDFIGPEQFELTMNAYVMGFIDTHKGQEELKQRTENAIKENKN